MASVVQTLIGDSSWTAPAGVKLISVTTTKYNKAQWNFQPAPVQSANDGSPGLVFLDLWGSAWGVGNNPFGNLGDGTVVSKSSPVPVLGGLTFKKLVGSLGFAIGTLGSQQTVPSGGLQPAGVSVAWGINTNGQLAVAADVIPRSSPVVMLGGFRFLQIYPGNNFSVNHNLALTEGGQALSWGVNVLGQLGDGTTVFKSSPVPVSGGFIFKKLCNFSGSQTSWGITNTNAWLGWGGNQLGILGVGDLLSRSTPVPVMGGTQFQDIQQDGNGTVYALDLSGQLWANGLGNLGQLGNGSVTAATSSPVPVSGGFKFVKFFASCASVYCLTADGTTYVFGYNGDGQLGTGDTLNRSTPVPMLGGLKFREWSGNGDPINFNFCAFGITTDNVGYSVGYGQSGILGNGGIASVSSPVPILGGYNFMQIVQVGSAPAFKTAYAVATTGDILAWGYNGNGQLGTGDVVSRSTPVPMLGGHRMQALPVVQTTQIQVVPGNAYNIWADDTYCTFGNYVIGFDRSDSVQIAYEQ